MRDCSKSGNDSLFFIMFSCQDKIINDRSVFSSGFNRPNRYEEAWMFK
jgi:hypothetical protein